jgi:CcdB protein
MAHFDVHRGRTDGSYPLIVDLQADVHAKLATHLVAPLIARARYSQPLTRLTPIVTVRDAEYVVLVPSLSAVSSSTLGEIVGSLASHRSALITAIDLLVTGS